MIFFDEGTGAIYRIEIDPTVKNKFNYIRSVFEITAKQYQNAKLAGSPVLQLSPTEDKQSAGRTLAIFLRNDNTNSKNVKSDNEEKSKKNDLRFSMDDNGLERTGTDGNGLVTDVRFLFSEYSEDERRDITLVLKPFVGNQLRLEDSEYQQYLAQLGIDVTESDAHTFAVMAMQENMRDIRKAAADKRDNYLYETFPLYREIVDIAGNGNFKIKPSSRFRGEDFSGSYISDAFVRFSQSKTKKNIASLAGFHLTLSRNFSPSSARLPKPMAATPRGNIFNISLSSNRF